MSVNDHNIEVLKRIRTRANAVATQNATITFGAPVSTVQVALALDYFKSKQVLKTLKTSENVLRKYASREIVTSELDRSTRVEFARMIEVMPEKKFWPRKCAAISYAIHVERKLAAQRSKRNKRSDDASDASASE